MKLSATNIVNAINSLPRDRFYNYPNPRNKSKIQLVSVSLPTGPIKIKRIIKATAKEETISCSMIQRYANAFQEGIPINIDRVLGASYNTRSCLEALLANTPEFYICKPRRIESQESSITLKKGHKHLMWNPESQHALGEIHPIQCDVTITEQPSIETVYGVIEYPENHKSELEIDIKRRHSQIQVALAIIGHQMGFRTYIAANDHGIVYNHKSILSLPSVIPSLASEKLLSAFPEGANAAKFIDCVWFKNGRLMPAVMEIEHSTGVTSGLARMQKFKNLIPEFPARWVIVAPDDDRSDVLTKCSEPQFRGLNARYFPYSAVEELFALCQKRHLKGVTEEFLDCFMEKAA
jgi:type II restriction enzyme